MEQEQLLAQEWAYKDKKVSNAITGIFLMHRDLQAMYKQEDCRPILSQYKAMIKVEAIGLLMLVNALDLEEKNDGTC